MTQNPIFHAQDTPRESVVLSGAQLSCLNFKKIPKDLISPWPLGEQRKSG